jgi:hypothetical protein
VELAEGTTIACLADELGSVLPVLAGSQARRAVMLQQLQRVLRAEGIVKKMRMCLSGKQL